MDNKSELEKAVEFALRGTLDLKTDEKRKWLGEFRERVVYGLTKEEASQPEAMPHLEKVMEDPEAEMLIVNNNLPPEVITKYMQLAKKANREYKSVATDSKEAMGLVIASRSAVDRENVEGKIKMLPPKFKNLKGKKLCSKCYNEIQENYKEYEGLFEKVTFGDKLIGIKCGACEEDKVDAILM